MAGRLTLVTPGPFEVVANLAPVDVDVRFTVVALVLVVALPKVSSRVTVNGAVAALPEAALNGLLVMTSLVAVVGVMVSDWVPDTKPAAVAVRVGVPALVSP